MPTAPTFPPRIASRTALTWLLLCVGVAVADEPLGLADGWKMSALGGARFSIRGTGDRNNPLRRQLREPFQGAELFVQFRFQYAAAGLDEPSEGEGAGEFFVLWMDAVDGGDQASHHGGVPNVGIHVADGKNRLMVRYLASEQQFSNVEVVGDREYQVVVRLAKSQPADDHAFDRLAMWVDPLPHQLASPAAEATSKRGVTTIRWLGFATGKKTEKTDTIHVSDVRVATTWREILGLPSTVSPDPLQAPPAPPPVVRTIDFTTHVYPILKDHCLACHAGADAESGVRLDALDEVLNQVAPRDAKASHLISLVRSQDERQQMPPPGADRTPLSSEQIETLETWIDEGLAWDERLLPTPIPRTDHWAFQPIARPQVPVVKNSAWVRTPVDAFVARQHQRTGVTPAPLAPVNTLSRRLALDITGLPLDQSRRLPEMIDAEEPPDSEDAGGPSVGDSPTDKIHEHADALVEQLLGSVAYGERWGRHWLDLARWAESNGYQHNRSRPHAWRYRDYVVRSFQQDKPFDRFVLEQLAGDELPYADEHLIATGFLAAARYSGNELDHEIQRNDILVDVVNTTGQALLGITLECAQCHTHKFDPLSIRDYYRLQAFFTPGQPGNVVLQRETADTHEFIESRWQMFDAVHARLAASRRAKGYPEPVLVIPKSVFGAMKGAERAMFQRLEDEIARMPQAWGWTASANSPSGVAVAPHEMRWPLPRLRPGQAPPKTYLRIRGDVKSVGPEVQPGWPAVFGETPNQLDKPRTALARWITTAENPLTARVWVNRLWQWHFGTGLVETSGDFGTQGASPSHPELLDWLACELIESGWSTKHVQRLILRSNTFRQASTFSPENHALDPDNKTLWRWQPRRLEAEAIRDQMLAVAGLLDATSGGPSVPQSQTPSSQRRSIYLRQERDRLPESMTAFDSPAAVASCSRRRVSTVSLQPLYLLNSPFMQTVAAALAKRVRDVATSSTEQVVATFEITLSRMPDPDELARATQFLNDNSLDAFCLVMINLNEFLYTN